MKFAKYIAFVAFVLFTLSCEKETTPPIVIVNEGGEPVVVIPPEPETETETETGEDSTVVVEPSLTITQNPDPVLPGTQHQLLIIEVKDLLPGQKMMIDVFKMTFTSATMNNQSVRPMLPFVNKDSVKVSFLADNRAVRFNDYTYWYKANLWGGPLYIENGKEFLTISTENYKEIHRGLVTIYITYSFINAKGEDVVKYARHNRYTREQLDSGSEYQDFYFKIK